MIPLSPVGAWWDNKFYMRHVSIIDRAGDYRWGAGYITVSVLWAFIQYILGWESKVLFRVKIYCWLLNFSFQQLSAQSTEIILPLQHYIIIFIFTIVKVRFNFMDTLQFAPAAHSFPKKSKLERCNKVYKYLFSGKWKDCWANTDSVINETCLNSSRWGGTKPTLPT